MAGLDPAIYAEERLSETASPSIAGYPATWTTRSRAVAKITPDSIEGGLRFTDARCGPADHEVTMATPSLYVLVRLWIQSGREAEFEAYERKVARIMARYGGVIERAIRTSQASDEGLDQPFEVHVLTFPSRDRYGAYRDDAERRSLDGDRARIIAKTDILVGTPGPTYGS
jgi:uncharacterized protein (DUF1330 family)